jgi:cellulose synthase/poly-beta-1,6-N-acetylglucosamine synthase-like glycosyltransferase
MTTLFWILVAAVFATVAGYGLVIIILASLWPHRRSPPPRQLSATLLIAAHNEEDCIGDKLANALDQDVGDHRLSILVVSDGSTDRTAGIVRACGNPRVQLLEVTDHVGKVLAMSQALNRIDDDIVIFSDANSHLTPGALKLLLDHFGSPDVGGVCGALAISRRHSGWLGFAEHIYWRYDNTLKWAESRLGGAVSAQGSLYAIRRDLLGQVPASVADDFFISTKVVDAGLRLQFEPNAVAVETVSSNTRGEFYRRVRSTERGWRALLARRRLLNPFRTGIYAVQLFFHKFLRRTVPIMLVAILVLSALLAGQHWIYAAAMIGQVLIYGIATATMLSPHLRRVPGAPLIAFVIETQIAMALGLARVALGKHSSNWKPVRDPSIMARQRK